MQIAILGGGPAGCAAAYFLKQHDDHDITIYEAEQLGGCAYTQHYDGIPFEFGPQIMFTDAPELQAVFETFLKNYRPPTPDGEYHYLCSIDGTLENMHDFPVTCANVLKLPNPEQVIYELYRVNLDQPDYSNFENYCISRVGKTLYETYIKNYNQKQWKIHPRDMDTEWVKYRPLMLEPINKRFKGQWQGHPGNYNSMWQAMASGCRIERGRVRFDDDLNAYVHGDRIEADLIISTLALSSKLEFTNYCNIYVVLKDDGFVMPAAFNTFPNTYSFVRIFEYKQQFYVESDYTLLDFEFPWQGVPMIDEYFEEVRWFCTHMLKKDIHEHWVRNKHNIYPLNTKRNSALFRELIERASATNVVATGRAGLHAYCSKDTCIRMAMQLVAHLPEVMQGGVARRNVQELMRSNLH